MQRPIHFKCVLNICFLTYLLLSLFSILPNPSSCSSSSYNKNVEKRHDLQVMRLEFFTEPSSLLVAPDGSRVSFKCVPSIPSADIRWLYNGTLINEDSIDGIRIARHKLTIKLPKSIEETSSALKDAVFQCQAQYKHRIIVSQPARLIIGELKPFAFKDNVNLIAIEGNTAVIACSLPYSVPNAVSEFDFNGTVIDKSKDRYHLMPSGDLQIFNVKESDSGIYRCISHNPFLGKRTKAKHHVQLTVKKSRHNHNHNNHNNQHKSHISPKFIVTPKSHVSAIMGSNVTLECSATGSPTPNITWKRMDGHHQAAKWRHHVQEGGNLILPGVRRGDEGTYVCVASNGGASASNTISANTILDIQELPQIIRPPEDRQVLEGEEIVLECNTKAKPKPIISWIHNGQLIKVMEETSTNIKNRGIFVRSSDGSKLTIPKAHAQTHSGAYQCFATNELGSTYATSFVDILNETLKSPPDNTKEMIPSEDDESVMMTSNNAGEEIIDEEDDFYGGRAPTAGTGNGGSLNRRRKNKNKGVKMVPPTRPEITRLSDDSVMVRWDVPNNDGLPILFFKVQYREMSVKGSDWNTVDEDIAPHIHSYAVNGLKAGFKYRFRIAAVYSNNDNKLGLNSIKFTLHKDPPMKKPIFGPTILQAEAVSPSAISLRWEHLDQESVIIEGFFIYYRATHTAGDYYKVTVLGDNTRSHIISHLLPDTSYDMKAQCFNVAGTSDFSPIFTCKTLPTPEKDMKGKGGKKDPTETNTISGGIGPVRSNDDKTLYYVLAIVIGALLLVFIVCIVLCIVRSKQQSPMIRPNMSMKSNGNGKIPKEKHPKASSNNHNYNHHNSNLGIYAHHRSNGHISNTIAAAASNGYLSSSRPNNSNIDNDHWQSNHQINLRMNPFCNEFVNGNSTTLSRMSHSMVNSDNQTLKSLSSSHHQLSTANNNNTSNSNSTTTDATNMTSCLNTLEKKRKRMDEHYPNVHLSNPRLNHHNSASISRLNGTLERKRRSRTDLVRLGDNETATISSNRCNGVSSNNTNGTLVIMQSSC